MTAAVLTRPPSDTGAPRRRLMRWAVALVLAVALAFVVVLPGRTWVQQNLAMRDATAELDQIKATNADLSDKIERLSQDDSIEQQARKEFGLVYPGEEPYTVLAPGPTTVNLPRTWPFEDLQDPLARAAARQALIDEADSLDAK